MAKPHPLGWPNWVAGMVAAKLAELPDSLAQTRIRWQRFGFRFSSFGFAPPKGCNKPGCARSAGRERQCGRTQAAGPVAVRRGSADFPTCWIADFQIGGPPGCTEAPGWSSALRVGKPARRTRGGPRCPLPKPRGCAWSQGSSRVPPTKKGAGWCLPPDQAVGRG